MNEYGENITIDCKVELHPGYDLWMQGARFGCVRMIKDGIATVRIDHPQVKGLKQIPVKDLLRR